MSMISTPVKPTISTVCVILSAFTMLLLFDPGGHCYAQDGTDKQLALQYFEDGEYDKAAVLYESLFDKSHLDYYYQYYLKCLIELKAFDKAEKVIRKEVKKNPEKLNYIVDLGYVYKQNNEEDKSLQQFDKALKLLEPDRQQVVQLANAFLARDEGDYSIKTYLKGRKLLKNAYSFHHELAQVYYRGGQYHLMTDEYLDLLLESPAARDQVQNILQLRLFEYPDEKALSYLHEALIKRIQRNPLDPVYSEMLIWYYVQREDFEGAFIQAKAIDKRGSEDGSRIIELGRLCMESKRYSVAIASFEYVTEKGSKSPYYVVARRELLAALNDKIINGDYTHADLEKLETAYLDALAELGTSGNTVPIMKGLAHLRAFYLDNTGAAIEMLEAIIAMPGVQNKEKARCKLELADILVLKGLIWDASLYYSQIDKDFQNDPLGHEAKFRNARLFYYTGEFEWAQTQLDVLKASTSKLIANDAMQLSLRITDNTIMDTTARALLLFAVAELKAYQNKYDSALMIFSEILDSFPMHTLTDDIYYAKAWIYSRTHRYEEAIAQLGLILAGYPTGILGDDALFMMATLYEDKLGNKEKAMELYGLMLTGYPGSLYVVEARKRFRNLRGDKVN